MYHPTHEKVVVKDYPYGFRLKTTMTHWVEFKKGKGFRHVTQTVNPKTGKLNKPNSSAYYPLMVLETQENGRVVAHKEVFYGAKEINDGAAFLAANGHLFNEYEVRCIFADLAKRLKVEVMAYVVYCGADVNQVNKVIDDATKAAAQGAQTGDIGKFKEVVIDIDALEATKVEGYNPFKVTQSA